MQYSFPVLKIVSDGRLSHTEIECVHPWLPFSMHPELAIRLLKNRSYKSIGQNNLSRFNVYVLTEEYPLMWIWWWLVYRLEQSLSILVYSVVSIALIWGLANVPCSSMMSLKHLFKRKDARRAVSSRRNFN